MGVVPGAEAGPVVCAGPLGDDDFLPGPGARHSAGSHLPGVRVAGAVCRDGRIVAITRVANAAPGKPDGEVDTRPLVPLWQQPSTPT
jgi:hypothetical protein